MSTQNIDISSVPDNIRELLMDIPLENESRVPSFSVMAIEPESTTVNSIEDMESFTVVEENTTDVDEEIQNPSTFSTGKTNNQGVSFQEKDIVINDEELYNIIFMGNSNTPSTYTLDDMSNGVLIDEVEIAQQLSEIESRRIAAEATNEEFNEIGNIEETVENIIKKEVTDTLNNNEKFDELRQRFSGASWHDIVKKQTVVLAGLGGIGSFTSLFLSRLSPDMMILYDPDVFETHNIGGQLVDMNNIGTSKINTAIDIATEFSNYYNIVAHQSYYDESSAVANVMICGFDNMTARKLFYNSWKNSNKGKIDALFIDGRLNMENFQVFTITGDNYEAMNEYEKEHLFNDDEVIEQQCSAKQTSHMAGMIGSVITNSFVNFCNNLNPANFERPLPFLIEYNGVINKFETHDKY